MSRPCEIFGIDLGTTNSCIATLRDGVPRVVPVDGDGIVPSVVSLDGETMLVGRKARNRAAAFPEQSVRSIKRSMGTNEKRALGGKEHTPEEISAMILRYLCDEAERIEGVKIERVVVTVPAYFSDAQRRATLEAGAKAGLKVERIINEPTAAALFYDQVVSDEIKRNGKTKDRLVLVYDLGGGTFDVTVLRAGEIVEVLSSTGDTRLGGDDFDRCIVNLLLDEIRQESGIDLEHHVPAIARLSAAAEAAKIELSSKANVWIRESHIPAPDGSTCSVELELSREQFESITGYLLERTRELVSKAISEASLQPKQIDQVLLVGGMTRMPAVADLVAEVFGDAPLPVVDPDRSVAAGAAIQGALITGDHVEQVLIDVTPHTLSFEALETDGMFDMKLVCVPMIPRNTQLPATRARTFFTIQENQSTIVGRVFQGESAEPEENTLLGTLKMGLAKAPFRSRIIVDFSYDLDGVVRITAEQKGFSRKTTISIDSRNPQAETAQDLEELLDDDEFETEGETPLINFVTARARTLLERVPKGGERDALAALLSRYEEALSDETADLDDIEDELLSMMEEMTEKND